MHELEVPLPRTCLEIHSHKAFGKEVVAGPVATVLIERRCLDWQIHEACFRIDRDLRPHTHVARPFPGAVFPCFISELSGIRNGVESPDQFAAAHVERADESFGIESGAVIEGQAFFHRRADNHCVVDDGRRRMKADFAALQIDLLILADDHPFLQIDHAVFSERRNRLARLGVQRNQAVADGDKQDAVVAFAVGPIRDTAARQFAR